ncbi:MAG TPA: alpha/beta hydrolase [Chloroflexota bacterium]
MDEQAIPEVKAHLWRTHDLVLEDVRLRMTRGGTGSPVLLLHGLTDAGTTWLEVAATLAGAHDVIVLDQRGHGKSSAPHARYAIADFVADAAAVISALDIAPAAVVGHSLGGLIALYLAAAHPYLVSRLVMEDPPLPAEWLTDDASPDEVNAAREAWFASVVEIRSMSPDQRQAHIRNRSPRWSPEAYVAWAESKLSMSPRLWKPGGVDLRGDWRAALREVHCPTLLIRGDAELGSLVNEAREREVLSLVPHAHAAHVRGASHAIHRDTASEYLDLVVPFLSGLTLETGAANPPGRHAPG